MTIRKITLALGAIMISLAMGAPVIARYFGESTDFHSAQFLPSPKPLINFILEDQKGDLFTAKNFNQHWSLVLFGFSHCPDMCPLALHELTQVLQMSKASDTIPWQIIFVSLDPERDTPENLKNYIASFDASIVGVRGTNTELAKLNHFFATDYYRTVVMSSSALAADLTIPSGEDMPEHIQTDYLVEHSGRVYIVNPDAQYLGSFTSPHVAKNIWHDLQLIIKR